MKTDKKRFVVDLDDTVCFPNHDETGTYEKYGLAIPNMPMIKFLQRVKKGGHYIILYSARRMLTHNGDVAKVKADVEQITRSWLEKYSVPYHELIFGKPYGDFYIDDKAVNPFTNYMLCDLLK